MIADPAINCEVIVKDQKRKRAREYVWSKREPSSMAGYYFSLEDYKEHLSFNEYWRKIRELYIRGKLSEIDYREYDQTYEKRYGMRLFS